MMKYRCSIVASILLVLPLSSSLRGEALSPSDSLQSAPVDTGDFAPGPSDFSRYTVPGLCDGAARYTSAVVRRTGAAQAVLDTIRDRAPTHDTLPAAAISAARRCATRFTVAAVPPAELSDLFTLALLTGNDSMAHMVVQRRLTLAHDVAQRDTVFEAAISGYLAAAPARLVAAEALVVQVDGLGTAAQSTRLAMHDSLLAFAMSTYDTVHIRREANRLIALGHEVPVSAIQYDYDPITKAYTGLLAIAFVAHPDSLSAIAAAAKGDLQRFPPGRTFPPGKPYWGGEVLDYKTASVDKVLDALSPLSDPNALGQRAPQLSATYWFPKAHSVWPPGGGAVSLIVYGGYGVCLGDIAGGWAFNMCGGFGELHAGALAKIARYTSQGIPTTIALESWKGGMGGVPRSALANADTLEWYYRDHLKLPVNVAVVVDSLKQIPAPDGRLFPCNVQDDFFCQDTSAIAKRYLNANAPVVLLGRDGQLLYSGTFSPLFDALLARIVAGPSTATATAGGALVNH